MKNDNKIPILYDGSYSEFSVPRTLRIKFRFVEIQKSNVVKGWICVYLSYEISEMNVGIPTTKPPPTNPARTLDKYK